MIVADQPLTITIDQSDRSPCFLPLTQRAEHIDKDMKIGLIGDYSESVTAHRAIPLALAAAAEELSISVDYQWVHSNDIAIDELSAFSALWCVPASPYSNTDNVLKTISFARTQNVPFLGTCGGYQHAALEFARNVLGRAEAENAEINPETNMPLISSLTCKLYDEASVINLRGNTHIAKIYGLPKIQEEYFCGYGVNAEYLSIFENTELKFTGFDDDGDPRSLEIANLRFFIGTAFQPERSALHNLSHPLIKSFLSAANT